MRWENSSSLAEENGHQDVAAIRREALGEISSLGSIARLAMFAFHFAQIGVGRAAVGRG
jgi:hypothetical protein